MVPHRQVAVVHPYVLPPILLAIVASFLCPGALLSQSTLVWLQRPCVQQYLLMRAGSGRVGCPGLGPVDGRGRRRVLRLLLDVARSLIIS